MKEYDTGLNITAISAVVVAIVVVSGLFVVTVLLPPGTPTTTPTTTGPNGGYGIRAADYLNNRRGDVEFYWTCNCTLVNTDISSYYAETVPEAFVDGVLMNRTDSGGIINVLFSPWSERHIGIGELSVTQWENLAGTVVNTIEDLPDYVGIPEIESWYPTLNLGIYFNDGTFFALQYFASDGVVSLSNGTWDGFSEWGWPNTTGYDPNDHWLQSAGLMDIPMTALYSIVTENVPYS
ncbi:MAG: hypothetical protein ACFFED_02950 [Candidatus Thorarchaeota archaeon]